MNTILYLSYLATVAAIIATPGPSAALMISHSIKNGKKAIIPNSAGSATAAFILLIISLFLIEKAIPEKAIPILSIIGSIYLIKIGIQNIKSKTNINEEKNNRGKSLFFQSFLTGASNPKDILFFIIFMPQFLDKSIEFEKASILLIIGWMICDLLIMSSYGLLATKSKEKLSNKHIDYITRAMGLILFFIGAILALNSIYELV